MINYCVLPPCGQRAPPSSRVQVALCAPIFTACVHEVSCSLDRNETATWYRSRSYYTCTRSAEPPRTNALRKGWTYCALSLGLVLRAYSGLVLHSGKLIIADFIYSFSRKFLCSGTQSSRYNIQCSIFSMVESCTRLDALPHSRLYTAVALLVVRFLSKRAHGWICLINGPHCNLVQQNTDSYLLASLIQPHVRVSNAVLHPRQG